MNERSGKALRTRIKEASVKNSGIRPSGNSGTYEDLDSQLSLQSEYSARTFTNEELFESVFAVETNPQSYRNTLLHDECYKKLLPPPSVSSKNAKKNNNE